MGQPHRGVPPMKRYGLSVALVLLAACGGTSPPIVPEEKAKSGNDHTMQVDYPKGPYGYTQGSTIENLSLPGQIDENGDGAITAADTVKSLRLSDYYANKKVKALFVGVAAG